MVNLVISSQLVGLSGLEPLTSSLSGKRSNQAELKAKTREFNW